MRNKRKIIIIASILIITTIILTIGCIFIKTTNPSITAVVLDVKEKLLTVMDIKDEGLYCITLPENSKNLQIKKGQEVKIYYNFDTIIEETLPASIRDIKKVKITKEKSDIEVPKKHLERVFNSSDNIHIFVDEISQTGITLTIKDTNEYKRDYKYSSDYEILDKTIHSTLLNKTKNKKVGYCKIIDDNTVTNTYNWENIFGKLGSGEYQFKVRTQDYYINIFIDFSIDEAGNVTYKKPNCGLMF